MNGDSNLIPSNIKSGVSIFGVNGTLSSSSTIHEGEFRCSSSTLYSDSSGYWIYLTFPVKVEKITGWNLYGSSPSPSGYIICAAHKYWDPDNSFWRFRVNYMRYNTNSIQTSVWFTPDEISPITTVTEYQAIITVSNTSNFINLSYPTAYNVLYFYTD